MTKDDKIAIENVNQPGKTYNVDAAKYSAMRECMIQIVPTEPPGISAQEMYDALVPALPQELWPNDEKVGWWQKAVQLDLEAKAILRRDPKSKPLRWWQPSTDAVSHNEKRIPRRQDQMSDDWKIAIWQQLGATIDMFGNALDACPDELWRERLWDDPSDLPEYAEFWFMVLST